LPQAAYKANCASANIHYEKNGCRRLFSGYLPDARRIFFSFGAPWSLVINRRRPIADGVIYHKTKGGRENKNDESDEGRQKKKTEKTTYICASSQKKVRTYLLFFF
jgi:hypothetical protein